MVTHTAVYIAANLTIYDGQEGDPVQEAEEWSRGAFTVANQNDTDGNGTPDWDDVSVPGEVDLIKIVLDRPIPAGTVNEFDSQDRLEVAFGATAGRLWTQSTKGTPFNGFLEVSGDWPKTLWLEGQFPSAQPRDAGVSYACTVREEPNDPDPENLAWDSAGVTFINDILVSVDYFRPTPYDGDHPSAVYTPLVKPSDKLWFKYTIRVVPTAGLPNARYHKARVALLDAERHILSSEEHTFSGNHYPDVTVIAGDNLGPLTIPGSVTDLRPYAFRVDAFVSVGGQILEITNVATKPVETHFQAVDVGQTICGEDNLQDASRGEVRETILQRWNFPAIPNGHAFTRSTLRNDNPTIYELATDRAVFAGVADLVDTVQHGRELGKSLLANPNTRDGNGPIYFYQDGFPTVFVDDAVAVNLLQELVTYGNKYFGPTSNPNGWTTERVKQGYDADPNDTLVW